MRIALILVFLLISCSLFLVACSTNYKGQELFSDSVSTDVNGVDSQIQDVDNIDLDDSSLDLNDTDQMLSDLDTI